MDSTHWSAEPHAGGISRSDALGDENHEITILRALNSQLCTIDERGRVRDSAVGPGWRCARSSSQKELFRSSFTRPTFGVILRLQPLHSLKKSGKYPTHGHTFFHMDTRFFFPCLSRCVLPRKMWPRVLKLEDRHNIHTYSDNTIFNGKLKHNTILHTDSKEATRGRNL